MTVVAAAMPEWREVAGAALCGPVYYTLTGVIESKTK